MINQQSYRKLTIHPVPLTDRGIIRSNNEDSYAGYEPTELDELQAHGSLYIVADGVGGAQYGERASQYAARKILFDFYQESGSPPADRLAKIIQNAGNEIFNYSVENGVRMATTLVAANIIGDKLTVANVGDSRAYLVRSGNIKQITHDHNRAAEMVRMGMLTSEEAKNSKGKNTLTRSLGGDSDEEVDLFIDIQLFPDDLILLCTDGLSRYASEKDILQLTTSGTLEEIAQRMINFAKDSGGADNITVYLIKVNEEGSSVPPIPIHNAPEAIDWDTISTIPGTRIRSGKTSKSIFSSIPHLVIMLVAVVILLAVTISILVSLSKKTNEQDMEKTQAVLSPIPTVFSTPEVVFPLATGTEVFIPTTIANTPIIETTNTNQPVTEPSNIPATEEAQSTGKYKCVHWVSQGETPSLIFTEYFEPDIALPSDGIYKFFYSCNSDKTECYGQKAEVTSEEILAGSYLVIPGVDQNDCQGDSNYWVLIPD